MFQEGGGRVVCEIRGVEEGAEDFVAEDLVSSAAQSVSESGGRVTYDDIPLPRHLHNLRLELRAQDPAGRIVRVVQHEHFRLRLDQRLQSSDVQSPFCVGVELPVRDP